MSGILLNLLAARTGGQVTRAEAFLFRFRNYAPNVRLVIIKECGTMPFIDRVPHWSVYNVRVSRGYFKYPQRFIWENLMLTKVIASEGLDTYLTFSHRLPFFLPKNVFTVLGVSNLEPFSENAWKIQNNLARLRLLILRYTIIKFSRKANLVICLSKTCKNALIDRGIFNSKIKVIPNGVDFKSCITNHSIQPKYASEYPYILTVSHFYRYKNFETLIHAFYSLCCNSNNTLKHKLIIVGKSYDKAYYEEINNLIANLGLKDKVIIIPGLERDALNAVYKKASIFVFTSLVENCPNILLEAMAHSLPIISSDAAPMPEFGGDAVDYFNHFSTSDLAQKLSVLINDDVKAKKMRILAKRRSKEFSWDTFTKSVIDICLTSVKDKL